MPNPKLPAAAQAWAALAALAGQADDGPDIARADYVGPIPPRIIAAALLDLRARVAALEAKP